MFKVVESSNGCTYVYSKDESELVCVVNAAKFHQNKPIGISRPIPKVTSEATLKLCNFPLRKAHENSFASTSTPLLNKHEHEDQETIESIDKDYSEECISNEEFLESLNLISKTKLETVPMKDLNFQFPYRNISRVTTVKPAYYSRSSRFSESVPMSCELMFNCLQKNSVSSKYLIRNEHELSMAVEKNGMFSTCIEHPVLTKLRCRDKKDLYPLTYSQLEDWECLERNYCFTKRQTREKLRIIETGLTKRGRLLLKQCKPCSVAMKKVSPEEIIRCCKRKFVRLQAYHQKRKFGKVFSSPQEQHPGLKLIINVLKKHQESQSKCISPQANSTPAATSMAEIYPCRVTLCNVLSMLSQKVDACYVLYSKVKVNDVEILPETLCQPSIELTKVTVPNDQRTFSDDNQSMKSLSPEVEMKKSECVKATSVIDMLLDKEKEEVDLFILPSVFTVQCYACSFLMSFEQKCLAEQAITDHLVKFHLVLKPELFLKTREDGNNVLIEAFPGLKV